MKPAVSQAQLETALLVSHHGNHELLREGIELGCRTILAGVTGLADPAPEWLRKWADRAEVFRPETVGVLVPALSSAALREIVTLRAYRWLDDVGDATVAAAAEELARRPASERGVQLY